MSVPDYVLEDTIDFKFTSRSFSTGAPTTLGGTPAVQVYEDNSVTQITSGITLTVDFDSVTGLNNLRIAATAANGFEAGKSYQAVISTGTVGGVSVVGEVVAQFSIQRAPVNWAKVTASSTPVDLSATDIQLCDTITTYTGNTVQTGDTYALANGATGFAAIDTVVDAILVDTGTTIPAQISGLNDPTAAAIADAVWDEAIEDHDTQGNAGWASALTVYHGQYGPGIWIDSGAANTNTVVGTDGTHINPVSTFAAARTLADAVGVMTYYIEGNSDLTLAATHVDWLFCGIGEVSANVVNLGSQDVSRSEFRNLTVEGTQGGSGRIKAMNCALQDPGAGDTTLHIFAERCGIVDNIQVDTSNDNVFDSCFSLVAGTGAPIIQGTGAAGTICIRHYSGGVEFQNLSASHNVTWEGMGQVIFNANCNVNATVALRGLGTITDNTAGMAGLSEDAFVNLSKINAEADTAISDAALATAAALATVDANVDTLNTNVPDVISLANINAQVLDVLNTDTFAEPGQGAPGATISIVDKVGYLYKAWRNQHKQTATEYTLYNAAATVVDQKATVGDDGTTATRQVVGTGP